MSCPYFDPVEPHANATSPRYAMLPLGDLWSGLCRAIPGQPSQPDHSRLQSCCNLGYARDTCSRFPGGDGPDAVRFMIVQDAGTSLRLYYVLERDHEPFAHGPLEYTREAGIVAQTVEGTLTPRQARAYVASYVRRKSEAPRPRKASR